MLRPSLRPKFLSTTTLPWFVDPEPSGFARRQPPQHLPQPQPQPPPLPVNTPDHLKHLHTRLSTSPHLDLSTLLVRQPLSFESGPYLPESLPKGRRQRGRSYAGEGIPESLGSIWSWIVMAQVKEGTENRGAIESVVRLVRKTLLSTQPPPPLPPNSKRRVHNGWAMIDAGDFAVHVLSKQAREKYFAGVL